MSSLTKPIPRMMYPVGWCPDCEKRSLIRVMHDTVFCSRCRSVLNAETGITIAMLGMKDMYLQTGQEINLHIDKFNPKGRC